MFEKVSPSHPDKIADRISGAIVDLCYTKSHDPKVACEVLIGHGQCSIQVETSEQITAEDIGAIVERIAGEGIETRVLIVPQDIHLANNQQGAVRCGDNGIFKGSAPTHEQKLLTAIAASIYDKHPHDGKYIIGGFDYRAYKNGTGFIRPSEDGKGSKAVTICQSHATEEEIAELWNKFWGHHGAKAVPRDPQRPGTDLCWKHDAYGAFSVKINPLGEWTGGPDVDCGATNRKLGSDMGDGVTGGGLHGKDLSKADVSVNIWCYLESIRTGHQVTASCSIGDETVNGIPYKDIVEQARLYIHTLGGFEKFAEWGLIRPLAQE